MKKNKIILSCGFEDDGYDVDVTGPQSALIWARSLCGKDWMEENG